MHEEQAFGEQARHNRDEGGGEGKEDSPPDTSTGLMEPPPAKDEHARGYSNDDRDLQGQRSSAGSARGE